MKLQVLDRRARGTRFVELGAKSILNSPESTGMPFWSLNPYVGCEFGCRYCFARFAHRYVVDRALRAGQIDQGAYDEDWSGKHAWEAFEREIFVKQRNAMLDALGRDLQRVRRRNQDTMQSIVVGTATDPYQPAERRFTITRAALGRLRLERGFRVGVITKSPLVCRDIDLLLALQKNHHLTLHMSLISMDDEIIRAFEPRTPLPHARLRALSKLVAAGVNAGVIVAPILPGITDGKPVLRALLTAAHAAGAKFAHPSPLRLYPGVRAPFLPALDAHFPALAPKYRKAYAQAADAPAAYRKALSSRFAAIAEAIGIPIENTPGPDDRRPPAQLALWPS
ncbi:MAG TPA: radical SAM protein [Gemmatimonadales bacterium]